MLPPFLGLPGLYHEAMLDVVQHWATRDFSASNDMIMCFLSLRPFV